MTLFDASVYGPETKPRSRHQVIELPVEAFTEPWRYVRNRRGILPYTHLIKANLDQGSIVTACDLKGSWMTMEGVTEMIRCPICDLAAQLS